MCLQMIIICHPFSNTFAFAVLMQAGGFTEVLLPSLNSLVPTYHNDNKTHERVI